MDINNMTLKEIEERLAAIDGEIEAATDVETVNALAEEKRSLLESEHTKQLQDLEQRRAEAKALEEGFANGKKHEEEGKMEEKRFGIDSVEYRDAFMKKLMGRELTAEERGAMDSGDASGGAAIPTITLDKIIQKLGKAAPVLDEIDVMHIEGNVTIGVEATVNEAALHTENAQITGAGDTLVKVSLGGYEVVKIIPISAKLNTMSINAFENWLVNNLTRSVAKKCGKYAINGTGSSEPKGIEYAEAWTDGTNAVDWAGTTPTVAEVQEQIGYLDGDYAANAKWLMSFSTFWSKFHVLRDEKKPEIISGDAKNGYFIFGFPVVIDNNVAAGVAYFGNYFEAVKANFAAPIKFSKSAESGFTRNAVDYKGDCLFDCKALGGGRLTKGAATI